jgi:hypothetical protein
MSVAQPQRRILRSVGAIVAGLIIGIALSVGTDVAMSALGVLPPIGKPAASDPLLVATVYRTIYGIFASYLAARLAPYRPMLHAMVLGVLDFIVSILGVVFTWNKGAEYGPHWYPIGLVILALPAAWVGGKLRMYQLASQEAQSKSAAV